MSTAHFDARALEYFRQSEESALSGAGLISAEANASSEPMMALILLASEYPERFVDLASCLCPVMQDVFFQYYLLGKTYSQIGAVLFPGKPYGTVNPILQKANRIGLKVMCSVIQCQGKPSPKHLKRNPHIKVAFQEMNEFQSKMRKSAKVNLRVKPWIGSFDIVNGVDLTEIFVPSWSVLTKRGLGAKAD